MIAGALAGRTLVRLIGPTVERLVRALLADFCREEVRRLQLELDAALRKVSSLEAELVELRAQLDAEPALHTRFTTTPTGAGNAPPMP